MIRDKKLNYEDFSIHFIEKNKEGSFIKKIEINKDGSLATSWPVVSLKKGLMSFLMFWTIGITDSYINSLNLEDNTSSRNFYDLLDVLRNNHNIALADDVTFKNIQILREKL